MNTKLIRLVLGLAALAALNGCATVVALQLKGKMPHVEADTLSVKASWAGVQVGILETEGLHYDANGTLVAAKFHEDIGTPTGGLEIIGTNVKIPGGK